MNAKLKKSTPVRHRPTSWWLSVLKRRAERIDHTELDLQEPINIESAVVREAANRFFNAAYRAEESGLAQAHELAGVFDDDDPDLAEVLRLYGDEEGWHREMLTDFLKALGGEIRPMGRVTRTLYKIHDRATRMDTIVLINLMFETIGSTTYRLAATQHHRSPGSARC